MKEANLEPEEMKEEVAQRQMESDLAKKARLKKAEQQKKQKEKAKMFSKEMNKGGWKPKTVVTALHSKKKKRLKKLPTDVIQSPDEEDMEDEESLLEGFCLQADSIHCINIQKLDEFQAYLHQICADFIQMVKQGREVKEEYRKVMRSIYWACGVVRNSSLIGEADPECVAGSVKDLNCVAWHQKLLGKYEAIPK